ncbi:hypothetical protein THFILI_03660 [Thermus filiformis]|uniref:Uncharacterized protein n=1 Tax=Thermus filiformis TaxID=276 RepID=A0A0D6X9X1_THEFI|nr:hypothetical protein THFILI_03660 [Thermus filiformis]
MVPGPNDYPLYYDSTNTKVLSAVATIDPTPLPLDYVAPAQLKTQAVLLEPGLNPNSSTGR